MQSIYFRHNSIVTNPTYNISVNFTLKITQNVLSIQPNLRVKIPPVCFHHTSESENIFFIASEFTAALPRLVIEITEHSQDIRVSKMTLDFYLSS